MNIETIFKEIEDDIIALQGRVHFAYLKNKGVDKKLLKEILSDLIRALESAQALPFSNNKYIVVAGNYDDGFLDKEDARNQIVFMKERAKYIKKLLNELERS